MDLLSSLQSKLGKPEEQKQSTGEAATIPGPASDRDHLIASAKVVAQAAQAATSQGADSVDKSKVAGAAADLLDAASKYGNLEGKSAGKLVDKAEEYLHQIEASSGHTNVTAPAVTNAPPPTEPAKTEGGGGGGVGQMLKMAQGLLNEQPGGQGTKEQ